MFQPVKSMMLQLQDTCDCLAVPPINVSLIHAQHSRSAQSLSLPTTMPAGTSHAGIEINFAHLQKRSSLHTSHLRSCGWQGAYTLRGAQAILVWLIHRLNTGRRSGGVPLGDDAG